MTVEAIEIDSTPGLNLEKWLTSAPAQELQRTLEERVLKFLFSKSPDDPQFQQIVAQLAWIGSDEKIKSFLAREIIELNTCPVVPCGIGKPLQKIGRFIEQYKTSILVGAGLCATDMSVAALLGYSLSFSAGGIAVAGTGSLFNRKNKEKQHPKIPNIPAPCSEEKPTMTQQPPKHPSNYSGSSFAFNGNPFFPSIPTHLVDAKKLPQEPSLPSIPNREPHGAIPLLDSWKGDFDSPSKYAPNAINPITGKYTYNEYRSRKFIIPGSVNSNMHLGWINGVNNSFEDSKENASYLQKLTGGFTVCGIYNCSHNVLIDTLEAGVLNYPGYSPNTAKLLQNNWKSFHESNLDRPNAKFLQVCHSQGAIHVKNALENLPPEIRNRVIVVAIAPAAVVPKQLCYQSFNYASENDVIYKLEPTPPLAILHGLDDVILPTFGQPIDNREELIILKAHSEAKGIDHEFQSRTYQDALTKIIKSYHQHGGEYPPNEKGS